MTRELAACIAVAAVASASATGAAPRVDPGRVPECPAVHPNGVRPAGIHAISAMQWHGNRRLAALLRPEGSVVTNELGGYKMRWGAKAGIAGRLHVRYWRLDAPAVVLTARSGQFAAYDRPSSTMSQMEFEPGCWRISGRVGNSSLSFVVTVMRGT